MLKVAEVDDRIRQTAEMTYQTLIEAELTVVDPRAPARSNVATALEPADPSASLNAPTGHIPAP